MIVDLTIGDPTLGGFLSGNRQRRFCHVNAQNLQSSEAM